MAVDANETKRTRVLTAVVNVATRTWTRGTGQNRLSFTVTNPQIRAFNGSRVLSVEVLVTRNGTTLFDDRVNMPNPPMGIRDAAGNYVENPLQALRDTLFDVVSVTTQGFTRPRLERNPDGSFRGDTLAVRAGTNDGTVASTNATFTTMAAGSGLVADNNDIAVTVQWSTGYNGSYFFCDFDTSALTADATISAAIFTFYGEGTAEANTNGYNLEIRYKDWGGTVTTADWFNPRSGVWTGLVSGGLKAVSGWQQSSGFANPLTDSGVYTSISLTGTTRTVLGLSGMASATPTGANSIVTLSADRSGTSLDPLLTITYTVVVDVSVTSVTATTTATANAPTPTVAPASTTATATAGANAPVIDTGVTNATVTSVMAESTATANAPTPTLGPDAVTATATAVANVPGLSLAESAVTAESTATANAPAPTFGPESIAATASAFANAPMMDHSLDSVAAASIAAGLSPTPTIAPDSVTATSTADANAPTPALGPEAVAAEASAVANVPGLSLAESSVVAEATATANAPTPAIGVESPTATVVATANAPTVLLEIGSATATATAVANSPTPTILALAVTATASAVANAPTLFLVSGPADLELDIHKQYRVSLHLPDVFAAGIEIGKTHELEINVMAAYGLELSMSKEVCFVGTAIETTATFTDAGTGAVVDPTTVVADAINDTGLRVASRATSYTYLTDAELTKTSTGIYKLSITPDDDGVWTVAFQGTGTAVVVNQDTFRAKDSIL